jgi:hypothetical protein
MTMDHTVTLYISMTEMPTLLDYCIVLVMAQYSGILGSENVRSTTFKVDFN